MAVAETDDPEGGIEDDWSDEDNMDEDDIVPLALEEAVGEFGVAAGVVGLEESVC